MKKSSDVYLTTIDALVGTNGRIYEITDDGEPQPVTVAVYDNVPEPGHTTAFSFGLSSAVHSEWRLGKPELMISVNSDDDAWALCMGEIIANYRASVLFEYGKVLEFGQRIVDDCPMTSFFIFASSFLDQSQERILLPDRTVNIAQMYPIHEAEAALLLELGIEKFFFKTGIDFGDVHRAPPGPRRTDA